MYRKDTSIFFIHISHKLHLDILSIENKEIIILSENIKSELTTVSSLIASVKEALMGKAQGANITSETVLKGFKGYKGQELVEGIYEPTIVTIDGEEVSTSLSLKKEVRDIRETDIPYEFYDGSAVVYNNEIHILCGGANDTYTNHYKWDGTSWTSVSTLPYTFCRGSAVVYNNEIHILSSSDKTYNKSHYKWDGTSWTSVSTLPYTYSPNWICSTILDNFIYNIISYVTANGYGYYKFAKWDGSSWTTISDSGSPELSGNNILVYNNKINMIGDYNSNRTSNLQQHLEWDGSSWTSVSTLPYNFSRGSAVVYKNEIHILGGSDTSVRNNHYVLDSTFYRPA